MFTRYNINDLFIAHIVVYSENGRTSCGYLTILKKNGENYIDLQNSTRIVTPNMIYKIDALNKYYTQDGKRKSVSRKNAVKLGEQHYESLLSIPRVKTM